MKSHLFVFPISAASESLEIVPEVPQWPTPLDNIEMHSIPSEKVVGPFYGEIANVYSFWHLKYHSSCLKRVSTDAVQILRELGIRYVLQVLAACSFPQVDQTSSSLANRWLIYWPDMTSNRVESSLNQCGLNYQR